MFEFDGETVMKEGGAVLGRRVYYNPRLRELSTCDDADDFSPYARPPSYTLRNFAINYPGHDEDRFMTHDSASYDQP